MRDDFSAVMLLLGREKATGGKVDEGHRGASGAKDGAWQAIRGRMAEEGGQWVKGAGRGGVGRGGATHTALLEGMGARDGRGSYARGQKGQGAGCALLSYPIGGEGKRGIEGKGASGFGLPTLSIPTAGQPIGRATGQPRAFTATHRTRLHPHLPLADIPFS